MEDEKVTTGELIWNSVCTKCFQVGFMSEYIPKQKRLCNCGGQILYHDDAIKKYGLGVIKESEKPDGCKVRITDTNFHLVSDI